MTHYSVEYLVIGVYMVFLVALGAFLARRSRNLSDYVRAGGQGTWWLVGSSAFMSSFSAYTFTANGSLAYRGGPTALVIFFAISCGLLVCAIFVGPWIRQTRAITLPDIIRERFGPEVEQFYVYLGVLLYPLQASIQLWALSVFCSSVFGFPLLATIVVFGVVVVAYSTAGGRWAVMATDFLQSLIVVPITLLVAFLCVRRIGGIPALLGYFTRPEFAHDFRWVNEPGQFSTNLFTWKWIVAMFLFLFLYEISFLQAQKYLSVKTGMEARKSAILSMCLMFFGGIIFLLPPMVSRFLFFEQIDAMAMQNPAESAYAVAAMQVLPSGLIGILVVAMFAASMSSMDTGLNESTGQIVNNLLPALRRKLKREPLSEKATLRTCKMVTAGLGGVIILYALMFARDEEIDIFGSFMLLSSVIALPMMLPFVFGIFIKSLPRWSYFFIAGCGVLPSVLAEIDNRVNDSPWDYQDKVLWIIGCGSAATLVSGCFFWTNSQQYRRRVDAFFKRMHTPIDFNAEVVRNLGVFQLELMGNVSLIASALLALLLLVPNPASGRLCVLFLCGFIAAVSTLLKLTARRESKNQLSRQEDLKP